MEEVIEGLGGEATVWRAAHPQATFDELATLVQQARTKWGRALMQALVAQREEVRPVPGSRCAGCGTEMDLTPSSGRHIGQDWGARMQREPGREEEAQKAAAREWSTPGGCPDAQQRIGVAVDGALQEHFRAKELRKAGACFRNNRDRMQYQDMRDDGWPIGSGAVEREAKQFKARFTGLGIR
jgi:hypothetical protein